MTKCGNGRLVEKARLLNKVGVISGRLYPIWKGDEQVGNMFDKVGNIIRKVGSMCVKVVNMYEKIGS